MRAVSAVRARVGAVIAGRRPFPTLKHGSSAYLSRFQAGIRDCPVPSWCSLALREYALGLEALDRVARGEPPVARARMRLRRPRPGIRTRGPAPVAALPLDARSSGLRLP